MCGGYWCLPNNQITQSNVSDQYDIFLCLFMLLYAALVTFFQLASIEMSQSAGVRDAIHPYNDRDVLNNLKHEIMEHITSLREDDDVSIEELMRQIDVIKDPNDVIGSNNEEIKYQNDFIRNENDIITNKIQRFRQENDVIRKANDATRKENEVIMEENDVIRKEHDVIMGYEDVTNANNVILNTGDHSSSDEDVNEHCDRIQDVKSECDTRIRHIKMALGGQRSTKGHTQENEMQLANGKHTNYTGTKQNLNVYSDN